MLIFNPKSANTITSSHVAPNAMQVTLAGTDVGFVIVAINWLLVGENTRIVSVDASKIRLESGDQRKYCIGVDKSAGSVTARRMSNDRVSRMISFDDRTVAIYVPLGLGKT